MTKKLAFGETAVLYGVSLVIIAPFIVVGVFFMMAVKACQGWCCRDALLEESEGMELESGLGVRGDQMEEAAGSSASASGNRPEESEGLLSSAKE